MPTADSEIFLGQVVVKDNKIIYVGKDYQGNFDEEIDCKQNLLMAGFINCHTHAAMTLLKGVGEGLCLEDWLSVINPLEEKMTSQDFYNGTVLAIKEMLKSGITTFQDCYFDAKNIVKACKDTGMRCVVAIGQNDFINKKNDAEKLYLSLKDETELVDYCFYCHATYSCNEKQYLDAISLARKYNKIVSTHMSETLNEVGSCAKQNGGLTPCQLLESYGFFDQKATVAHAVYLEKEDYEILSKNNVSVIHNPSSNLKLGSGIANLKAMKSNKINICLGTDGSASNNRLDMFREMYLASVLQKALFKDSKLFPPNEVIKMATENGAKALNNDKIGSLKVGNFADMIMIDLHSTSNAVCNDIKSNLVYACSTEDVLMTMINGKVLYKSKNNEIL